MWQFRRILALTSQVVGGGMLACLRAYLFKIGSYFVHLLAG
jgi:hypothetical protein